MSQPTASTAIAARITANGPAAVAAVAVWGAGALAAVEPFFTPAAGKPLVERPFGRIVFGRFSASPASAGEEVVVCRHGEGEIEIHCHGGLAACGAILNALASAGCQIVQEADWIARRESDPFARAALAALAQATTARTAAVLLDQYRGALRRAWRKATALLQGGELYQAERLLKRLAQAGRIGKRLVDPWRVALVGAPNAGKSTLLNALVGFERAIADAAPGTTRDVVTARCAFDGWPVELADTAGLRETSDDVEAQGVSRARRQAIAADLVIYVRGAREAQRHEEPAPAIEAADPLVIYNKLDLLDAKEKLALAARGDGLLASALNGEGVAEIAAAIAGRLVPMPLDAGEAVPFTASQAAAVEAALAACREGKAERAATILLACD
jgi:tRNA modification GTPase